MPARFALRHNVRPRARLALLAAAAVCALGVPQPASAPDSAAHDAQALFTRWMRLDAPAGDAAVVAAAELAQRREWLAAAFAHAVEAGPSAEELEFALTRRAPAGPITQTAAADAALRRMAAEVAHRRQVERAVRHYRARALLGLALLGDAAALARIGQHASDRDDPLAPEARAALRIVQAN
ncbi:MAG: hypothetical protein ACOY5V_15400 [Pseudomonadota bacterium]